jgi:hypothetical protein
VRRSRPLSRPRTAPAKPKLKVSLIMTTAGSVMIIAPVPFLQRPGENALIRFARGSLRTGQVPPGSMNALPGEVTRVDFLTCTFTKSGGVIVSPSGGGYKPSGA